MKKFLERIKLSVDVKLHIFDDTVLSIHDLEVFFSHTPGKYFNPFMNVIKEEDDAVWKRIAETESICIEEVLDDFSEDTNRIINLIKEDLPTIDNFLVYNLSKIKPSVGYWASNFYGKKLFWICW